ncbi:sulfotransferase family protein [Paraburkholderia sp. BL6669N2]|uniref:sulfotransferase family protein n=1 Tax=Paraburkholderia sp. BL6669N2 TaxID=1938807 RepID=UPI000E22D20B|nr:sulfotransferase [Paraburkholderia sp. BL6669N2]REG61253.1 sulfotransferase family protein [Paraburkholderia sp. BL6669N2]
MFIIFGSPRSGTTLLKESLNLHPDIFIPMQTTIISTTAHIIGTIGSWEKAVKVVAEAIVASDDYPTIFAPYLTEAEVRTTLDTAAPSLAGVLDALYGALASKLDKLLCGDKSPDDLLSIRKLEQVGLLDSQLKFIHIVRDVRGSVASLLNVDWAPAGIEEYFPRIWNYTNLHLYKKMHGRHNYVLIKYEDLVATPNAVLTHICDMLGLPFSDSMLDASKRGPELRTNPSHRNLAQPFLTDRIDVWRSQLPADVSAHCEYSAREAMYTFGYK